jgi:uncharacterized membrane protein YjgN (DUF898 family)
MQLDAPRTHQVEFSGRAGERFGIWIVNLLLTIVTFGIYSAWAKVRRNRYFFGNTTIDGRGFDYHAAGLQILIGRLIVAAGFVVLSVLSTIPLLGLLAMLTLVALVPWLIIRGLRFQARNTSWSNVRFDFRGSYGDAFVTYILLPIGVALTLYTTLPFLTRRINRFVVGGHGLGRARFEMRAGIGPFYEALLMAIGWVVASGAVIAVLGGGSVLAAFGTAGGDPDTATAIAILVVYAVIFLCLAPAATVYFALVRNAVYANASLAGGHRFDSTVRPLPLVAIAVTNAVAVVCTLGLALPWTQIRLARYMASNTFVMPNGSLDHFAGTIERDRSAIGDAYGDLEGLDFGAAAI